MMGTKRWLAGLLCAVLLAGLLPMEARAAGGHWADDAVTALNNIYGSDVFQAEDTAMTQGDAYAVLSRMGCKSEKVSESSTAALTRGVACEVLAEVFQLPLKENQSAIEYLYRKNIINGYADGALGAEQPITKAQFAVITYRVLNSVGGGKGSSNEALKPGTKEYFAWMYLAARSVVQFGDATSASTETISSEIWQEWITKLMRDDEENRPGSGIPADAKPSVEFSPTCPDSNTTKLDAAIKMVDAYIQAGGSKTIFSDVPADHWGYDGIMYLFDREITTGYGNGVFGVNDNLNRQTFALVLFRAKDQTTADRDQLWEAAKTYATTSGYMTIPDSVNTEEWWSGTITREEAVVGFMKAFANQSDVANANTDILNCFTDTSNLSTSTEEARCIAYAVSIGILNGTGQGALNLSGTVDRGTAGVLLYRTLIGVDKTKMKDYEEDVSYAKGGAQSQSLFSLFSIAPLAETDADKTLTLREDWRLTADLDLAVPEGETLTITGKHHIYEMGGRLLNSGLGTVVFAEGNYLYPADNDEDGKKVTKSDDGKWDNGESDQLMQVRQPHTVTVNNADTNGTVTASGTGATTAGTVTAKMGDTVTLTVSPATGYELDTLTVTDADSSSVTVTDNAFTMPASNVTVSATFKAVTDTPGPTTYTVTFNANGGSGSMDAVTVTAGESYTLPSCGFTAPEGKQFKGWATAAGGEVISGGTYQITADTTLYAIWEDASTETKALVSIAVTTAPSKTAYAAGETFSSDGMVITATYSDGAAVPVTGYTVSPAGALAASDTAVTISYSEGGVTRTTTVSITVTEYAAPVVPVVPATPDTSSTTTTTQTNPDGSTTTTTTNTITGAVTEITRYADGSTTTVEIARSGVVTTTEKAADGSTIKTVENPDGSSDTTVRLADGTTAAAATDRNGRTEAEVNISASAANSAASSGEAIPLPIPAVAASSNSSSAPVVSIGLPSGAAVSVEIPVADVTAGAVAVAVNADGSETVVRRSVVTESGVALSVSGGATVKIIDNSKYFEDVHPVGHWAQDSIDFVSSRELFNGADTAGTIFSPSGPMTRAMLMTVLARLDGVDTDGGSPWYEPGMSWAMANGVSDGTDPNSAVTREQLVTMLYRQAGSPAVGVSELALLGQFADGERVSAWAQEAMAWAVSGGVLTGDGGALQPQATATRAQVAAVLARFCGNLM